MAGSRMGYSKTLLNSQSGGKHHERSRGPAPMVRMVAARTACRLSTTLRSLALAYTALGVVSEMPAHEPGAQQGSLWLSPQIVIEQADRHQGRQTTNDQAVPRTSQSGAPVTGTDRDE